jgi:hypothetical protein
MSDIPNLPNNLQVSTQDSPSHHLTRKEFQSCD